MKEAQAHELVRRIEARLPDLPITIIEDKNEIPPKFKCQTSLLITAGRGELLGRCPGSPGHLCCNYLTIDLYEGCPIGCSYCIMQSYLNFRPQIVNADIDRICEGIARVARLNPHKTIRLGTGETGDSLFFDPLCELSKPLIIFCAQFSNVFFELKTKTSFVDHLLDLEPKGKAILAFSINPPSLIKSEEGWAASLDERINAARKALQAGYRLAFHFDPIISFPGWEKAYGDVVRMLFEFPEERISWISLGTIRYPQQLKDKMPPQPYLFAEFVPCRDGKYRYIQSVRVEIYKKMLSFIRLGLDSPVYLCMESSSVWKKVFGNLPSKIDKLCAIFNNVCLDKSLQRLES